jgi:aspartate beta-hydroxylase
MTQSADSLARAAGEAANAGRWEEAERLWAELHRREPDNPKALFSLGVHALQARDAPRAAALLEAARASAPDDLLILHTLAVARREAGDDGGEREAIDAALARDPYHLPALLAKAAHFERLGKHTSAAVSYRHALSAAPPEPHWPAQLRAALAHGREVAARHAAAFEAHLARETEGAAGALSAQTAGRWREAAALMAGRTRPYHAQCNQLTAPRLPAIPFFERAQFPWAAALEAQTGAIRDELAAALAADRADFSPYIAIKPGAPINQWRELNNSGAWSAYHLWRRGAPVAEHIARCPRTAAALGAADMAEMDGLCPNAMFSALAPHTHIPPHNGETNARLVAHLPLIVPEGCSFRVGFETRGWRVGELIVFDDSIEHEARNDSDDLRVVLIFDVWNPLLEPTERRMVQSLLTAARAFGDQ